MQILMPNERRWNYYLTVIPMALFVILFFVWAAFADIDEVVRGQGRVIPSSQTQVLQHLEGGIITAILVKEGQNVKKGDVIYQLDQAFFDADLKGKELETLALKAKERRIQAMLGHTGLSFDPQMQEKIPQIISNEMMIYNAEQDKNSDYIRSLEQQLQQKSLQVKELEAKVKNLTSEYNIASENLEISEKLLKVNATSKREYLQELSKKQNLSSQIDDASNKIPSLKKEMEQTQSKISAEKSGIRAKLLNDLADVKVKLQDLEQKNVANVDRDNRKQIVSPVNGTVNKLSIHTVGGIIKPGDPVAEITPDDDSLMVEASVKASDRGRVWSGQKVAIEITAYDFARYGMLDGVVNSISPDSTTDQQGNTFYKVYVKATHPKIDKKFAILPGMIANINILTGKKTILEYLVIPIKKVTHHSLNEN